MRFTTSKLTIINANNMLFWKIIMSVVKFFQTYFPFSRFYPYLLLTSSFFLFLTLLLYTIWPKLLTHYTRIMRHYTLSLFLAFVILAINQFHTLKEFNLGLCIACGEHYFMNNYSLNFKTIKMICFRLLNTIFLSGFICTYDCNQL